MSYPPHRDRGVGHALPRASRFSQIRDYAPPADEQTCLLVQGESRKGQEALDDILAPAGLAADVLLLSHGGQAWADTWKAPSR